MNEISKLEYDQRQYQLMLDQISLFKNGRMEIGYLIRRLKALLATLETAETAWKEEFTSEWGTLEIVYAMVREQMENDSTTRASLIKDDAQIALVSTAVENLRSLITHRLRPTPPS